MIEYTSDNGFTGYLYGESSMTIGVISPTGQFIEYLHTGSRAGNTKEYLKEMVDSYPEFLKATAKINISELKEEDDEEDF